MKNFLGSRLRRAFAKKDQNDPYLLLGVTRKASPQEIKNAYRRRIRELHPDLLAARGVGQEDMAEAHRLLASVNVAYGAIIGKHRIK